MDIDNPQQFKMRSRNIWLGLLAGLAALTVAATVHQLLADSQRLPGDTAFNDYSDSSSWLLLQLLDFGGGMAAGAATAHWSKRLSWRALLVLLAALLGYAVFAQLPSTRSGIRRTIWMLAIPFGVMLGACVYRYRERRRPEMPARIIPPDHLHVPHTWFGEALAIVSICFGYFILNSTISVFSDNNVRVFSDSGLAVIIVMELMLGSVAAAVLWVRSYPLPTLLPRPSWGGLGIAAVLYMAVSACSGLISVAVSGHMAQPVADMVASAHVSLYTLIPLSLVNGTYEEVFLLAFLQRGLRRLGASNAIGITVLVRLLYHTYQGPVGVMSVLAYGLVVGLYYWRSGRLFPVIAVHVAADFAAFS
jgi:membrane protease YdiL (CAAX protease family)